MDELVRQVYRDVLEREGDDDGVKMYSSHLQKGRSIYWLKNVLRNSPEYKIKSFQQAEPEPKPEPKPKPEPEPEPEPKPKPKPEPMEPISRENKEMIRMKKEMQERLKKQSEAYKQLMIVQKECNEKELQLKKREEQLKQQNEAHKQLMIVQKECKEKELQLKKREEQLKQRHIIDKETNLKWDKMKSEISQSETLVNVFLCVRDNQNDLALTLSMLRIIERNHKTMSFNYYIMENDSSDDTPHQILDFFKCAKGRFRIEKIDRLKWGTVAQIDRVRDMADYRNMMKKLCTTWDGSKYSLIVDTGVRFNIEAFDHLVKAIETTNGCVMATPFGTVDVSNQYYDTYALELKNGRRGLWENTHLPIVEVNSAFGGFVVVRSSCMQKCDWGVIDGDCSEHNHFCKMMRRYGKVVVATDVIVRWNP